MMSASSSTKMIMNEQATQNAVSKPKWLEDFLGTTFFNPCSAHSIPKTALNSYCINCNVSTCQYCVSSGEHYHHNTLKVFRYIFREVVPVTAMEQLINCSQIQPFKCNKRLVFSLKPLPHSGLALSEETSCKTCNRKMTFPNIYDYCSISCKVTAFLSKSDESVPPFICILSPPCERPEETTEPQIMPPNETQEATVEPQQPPCERKEVALEPSKRKRNRKGTPHRAPFF